MALWVIPAPAIGRSYARDLLRWSRLLWLVDVGREQATEAEAAALAAVSDESAAETVLHGFYEKHRHYGTGPVINPVLQNPDRRTRLTYRSWRSLSGPMPGQLLPG